MGGGVVKGAAVGCPAPVCVGLSNDVCYCANFSTPLSIRYHLFALRGIAQFAASGLQVGLGFLCLLPSARCPLPGGCIL